MANPVEQFQIQPLIPLEVGGGEYFVHQLGGVYDSCRRPDHGVSRAFSSGPGFGPWAVGSLSPRSCMNSSPI